MSTSNPDQITVTHGNYSVTVKAADIETGWARSKLNYDLTEKIKAETPDMENFQQYLRVVHYTDLVSAVSEYAGFSSWPPTFDEFMKLPEQLGNKWQEATYKVNPHWDPQSKDKEKKSE